MRVEKIEKIFLSQKEVDTWKAFSQILEEIEKQSNNAHVLELIGEIICDMSDLWNEVEDIDYRT